MTSNKNAKASEKAAAPTQQVSKTQQAVIDGTNTKTKNDGSHIEVERQRLLDMAQAGDK